MQSDGKKIVFFFFFLHITYSRKYQNIWKFAIFRKHAYRDMIQISEESGIQTLFSWQRVIQLLGNSVIQCTVGQIILLY